MTFGDLRPVYVIGIGMNAYHFLSEMSYVELGLNAIREALDDADVEWPSIESAYVGTGLIGMAAGRVMTRHLGSTGLSVTQVENASSSGCAAFRLACLEVASGQSDLALAVGVDKPGDGRRAANKDGLPKLCPSRKIPAIRYALLAEQYMHKHGVEPETLAKVAVKNHANAARNPYAQFRKRRTLDQVLQSRQIAGALTQLQCCPVGEGAAATIIASESAIKKYDVNGDRAVRVAASSTLSERLGAPDRPAVVEIVRDSARAACKGAGISPKQLDLIELHDAFSVEELIYTEAIGVCGEGEGGEFLLSGASEIGGECAVNASGGLIGMGHPIGPTGIGQICEIVRQLRGESEGRQHAGAKIGMAHMIGLGSVAYAHILTTN